MSNERVEGTGIQIFLGNSMGNVSRLLYDA